MDIAKSAQRAKLAPRREPYWKRLARGNYIGVRKTARGEYWIARYRDQTSKQHYRALTQAQSYDEADRAAREWFASCGRGIVRASTVEAACKAHVAARG